jgi:hypothetical protein
MYVLSQQLLDAGRHVRCTLADSDRHAVNEAKWKLPRGQTCTMTSPFTPQTPETERRVCTTLLSLAIMAAHEKKKKKKRRPKKKIFGAGRRGGWQV